MYFCRIRVQGRLIRKSLKTDVLSGAKPRLTDEEKKHRQLAQRKLAIQSGRGQMTFADALEIYRARLDANPDIKSSSHQPFRPLTRKLATPEVKEIGLRRCQHIVNRQLLSKPQGKT